ncbi:nucleotide-diphospho-sugar transferase, partial [Ophiobolus disseminans]
MSSQPPSKNAYITLLTRPSYLAGALLLAHTLTRHSPSTPLIITYTPDTLPETCVAALRAEAKYSNIVLRGVEHLRLPDVEDGIGKGIEGGEKGSGMVAERFIDTWTKLRVFDCWDMGFESVCWVDADMMVFSDPSPLIFNAANDAYLTGGDGTGFRLMAVHTCVCNLDHDSWAPESWTPENCALAKLDGPGELADIVSGHETLGNFNSGTFLYRPTQALAQFVKQAFQAAGNDVLRAMKFPDQDFLNLAFTHRWSSLSWRVNALKTWRYWHANIWRDDQVSILHYIVDKPWAARPGADGRAGYLGKDGETHGWWWDEYARWEERRRELGEEEMVGEVRKYVAGGEGEGMKAIGGGAQDYAKKFVKREGDGKEGE